MNNLLNFWAQLEKRTIDLLGSILGLLFLAPFLGLTALLIQIDSPGGTFYRQPRLGRNGKVFNLLKFRTMYQNADQILAEKLARDPFINHEWGSYQKLRKDPRVTWMGRFLRKFSLDELPQLWNVLVGEMSLVGPRPMMTNQSELYGDSSRNTPRLHRASQACGRFPVAIEPPSPAGLSWILNISSAGLSG